MKNDKNYETVVPEADIAYIRDINKIKQLPEDVMTAMFQRIKSGTESEATVKRLKDQIVEANMRLVVKTAYRFTGRGVDLADMITAGSLGLMKAVDNFDLSTGCMFSTYAIPRIEGFIREEIRKQGSAIQLGQEVTLLLNRMYMAENKLMVMLNKEAASLTDAEIAAEMQIPEDQVRELRQIRTNRVVYSVEQMISPDDEDSIPMDIPDRDASASKEILAQEKRDHIIQIIGRIKSQKVREVLIESWGLGDHKYQMNLAEVGRALGKSREAVRQLYDKGVNTIKTLVEEDENLKRELLTIPIN